jgi:hypothetical protein
LRSFPVGRYVIIYLAIPCGVQIVLVLHGWHPAFLQLASTLEGFARR